MLWTASTIWAQKNAIFEHYTHYPKLWMEQSISKLLSDRIRWLAGVTLKLTAGSQNRLFSLLYSDPNKKNVLSQRYSSFPCIDLDPYVWARSDLFWRILMYTSRQDLPFTNKCRLKLHPVSAIYKRFLSIQFMSQAVTFRSRLYSERLVCQKLDSWYC